ncbi:MAG: hypothetical protein OZ948_17965 [Deltaproteobacteria bacterium]|nr:hypothetical protein [Deltaproteobacteria bacterium]
MRGNDFGTSVVFAATVAIAWPAVALVAAPLLGARGALSLYLVAAAALYGYGIAPDRVRGTGAALATAALGALVLLFARDAWEAAVGAAVALGVVRSALLYRSRPARALAIETALLGGGLLLARWLATPGPLGIPLALWGFFAVQAGFFAIGGVRERAPEAGPGDRFERARRRALALLDSP